MLDYKKVSGTIKNFIIEQTKGSRGGVIGLSGGLDSTVVAYLTAGAIGKENVYGLIMPYFDSENTADGIEVAERLGINYKVINIKPIFDKYLEEYGGEINDDIAKGNLMARIRMSYLYLASNLKNMRVIGTSNTSEIMVGYLTKYGDGGVDCEPIGGLYKTEVWELAKFLGVPRKIIEKMPSAELEEGQTDEDDLGMDYYTLDKIINGKIEGIEQEKIERFETLFKNSEHKRRMPPIAVIER